MQIGAGLASELQRLFKIEGDDRGAGVFEQEVAQRGDGDLMRDLFLSFDAQVGVTRLDFLLRIGFETVDQVVGFDAQAFASRHSDLLALRVGFR